MRLLLDTNALIWWLMDTRRLSKRARDTILTGDVWVSAASAWELAIKRAAGKLESPADLPGAMRASEFRELPITVEHALAAAGLPQHHRDPFDRMLVAQAQLEDLTLVTADQRLAAYGIATLPAQTSQAQPSQ